MRALALDLVDRVNDMDGVGNENGAAGEPEPEDLAAASGEAHA
jgi:hypothetical protein